MLFVLTFTYFCFFGSHVLFFQEKASLFVFSADFLRENLRQPGGFLVWLEKLLVSFYFYPPAGALLLSSVITLSSLLALKLIRMTGEVRSSFMPLIPGIILFYLHTDYRFTTMNSLGILLALIPFSIHSGKPGGWFPLAIAPVAWYLIGGFAWIYISILSVFLIFNRDNYSFLKLAGAWITLLIFVFATAEWIFFGEIRHLLIFPVPGLKPGFVAVVVIIVFLPATSLLAGRYFPFAGSGGKVRLVLSAAAISLLLTMIALFRYDEKTSRYFHAEKLFYEGRYKELVDYNSMHAPTNSLTVFLNNIALCETGQLNDRLLSFNQKADGSTLFLKWEMIGEILRRGGYFYYAIGMINEAHRWAYENMVISGPSPEGLKLLIRTELINGNYKMAGKYTDLLAQTLFYRNEARYFRRLLADSDLINSDPDLGQKKKIKPGTDFFSITDDPWINIQRVLDLDSLNKPAFDYRIAYLLLNKQYQALSEELPGFGNLGYKKLPLNVEEAALAMSLMNNNVIPGMGKLQLSTETQERWIRYLTTFQKYGNDPRSAEPALRKDFGNTFWYYAFYK